MSKVLLELYSNDSTENIISMLSRTYDRAVFFFGPDNVPNTRMQAKIISFFQKRFGADVSFREIKSKSFEAVTDAFAAETPAVPGDSYFFDLTGGSPLFIAAAGYYVSSSGRQDISMHLYDPKRGGTVFEKGPGAPDGFTALSFSDAVLLNGGLVLSSEYSSNALGDREFVRETMRLWNAVRGIPLEWNRFCSVPYADPPLGRSPVIRRRTAKKNDEPVCRKVLEALRTGGIVATYEIGEGNCDYVLSDTAPTAELYEKSGSVLEVFTALAAACTGLFYDISASTRLDYDGVITGDPLETRNEIDVTMMYGHRPVFVSCKNTEVTKEYLYEIQTMAEHFGGKYAIPAIVTSVSSNKSVQNRAKEMGIVLLYSVASVSRREFSELMSRKFTKYFPRIRFQNDR